MTKGELRKQIYKSSFLRGHFVLRSGQHSSEYFDKYCFQSQPLLLQAIAKELKQLIPKDTQILAGLEMGAIAICAALSLESNLPCVFVRKEAKKYGTAKCIEGISVTNKKLCIIEDIISTGGQVLLSHKNLCDQGAQVSTVLCVINRSPAPIKTFADNNLQMLSLFNQRDFNS